LRQTNARSSEEKTSENQPRWKTRIASMSSKPFTLRRELEKNYGRRTLKARRPDNENPNQPGSELGRQIAVDLEADADFDECRCGPGHDLLHLVRSGSEPPAQPSIRL
jgi:hypothetical protein